MTTLRLEEARLLMLFRGLPCSLHPFWDYVKFDLFHYLFLISVSNLVDSNDISHFSFSHTFTNFQFIFIFALIFIFIFTFTLICTHLHSFSLIFTFIFTFALIFTFIFTFALIFTFIYTFSEARERSTRRPIITTPIARRAAYSIRIGRRAPTAHSRRSTSRIVVISLRTRVTTTRASTSRGCGRTIGTGRHRRGLTWTIYVAPPPTTTTTTTTSFAGGIQPDGIDWTSLWNAVDSYCRRRESSALGTSTTRPGNIFASRRRCEIWTRPRSSDAQSAMT